MDFITILAELKGGRVAAQCGEDWQQLVAAVKQHGGSGKLTLELTVTPSRITLGVVKEVDVSYKLKLAEPRANHGATMFYVDEESRLSRQDPAQMALEYERERTN